MPESARPPLYGLPEPTCAASDYPYGSYAATPVPLIMPPPGATPTPTAPPLPGMRPALLHPSLCYNIPDLYPAVIARYRGHFLDPNRYSGKPPWDTHPDSLLAVPDATGHITQLIFYYGYAYECQDPDLIIVRESAPGVTVGRPDEPPPEAEPACGLWHTVTYAPDGTAVVEVYSHHRPAPPMPAGG